MKNKIKKFSKGDFRTECPEIVFPETHIRMMIGEGEVYSGSFMIQNQKRGISEGLSIRLLFVFSAVNKDLRKSGESEFYIRFCRIKAGADRTWEIYCDV
ncbi:MAG: DUF5717 family protein [Coprococcus phoceensis]